MVRKISLEFLSAISLKFFTSFQNNNAAFRCYYCQEPRERLQRSNDVIIIQNGARQERAVFDYRFCVFFYLALLQKYILSSIWREAAFYYKQNSWSFSTEFDEKRSWLSFCFILIVSVSSFFFDVFECIWKVNVERLKSWCFRTKINKLF